MDEYYTASWFAWFPVKLDSGKWVWLKTIGRQYYSIFHHEGDDEQGYTYWDLK